jgi:hypothetical protein
MQELFSYFLVVCTAGDTREFLYTKFATEGKKGEYVKFKSRYFDQEDGFKEPSSLHFGGMMSSNAPSTDQTPHAALTVSLFRLLKCLEQMALQFRKQQNQA